MKVPWLWIYIVVMGLVLLGVGRIIEWRWERLGRPTDTNGVRQSDG